MLNNEFIEKLSSREWRLSNLYKIKDEDGKIVQFVPNWAQVNLLNLHYLNIIVKARQLGVTTFFSLLFLDTCLFNNNVAASIIADSQPNAKAIFQDKVKFAYDNLDSWVKKVFPAYRDNANELRFQNGSIYKVGTSIRSGTYQLLHVTEFAKICQENPSKAREIMTGALNTIHKGQFACIESTARGREGQFYRMCNNAMQMDLQKKHLTEMDWKFWFFPWWKHPEYILDKMVYIPDDMGIYFDKLEEEHAIFLMDEQKWWYVKKWETQQDYMKREYPSTPEEAFESSNEGFLFGKQMARTRKENRICRLTKEEHLPIYIAADIGIEDKTALWVFQVVGKDINYLDYYENSDEDAAHYINWIKRLYGEVKYCILPHDADHREKGSGKTYGDYFREAGLNFRTLEKDKNEMFGIQAARVYFTRMFFDVNKCKRGIECLDAFRKEWNDKLGCYREKSFHNWASHAAKSLIYSVEGIQNFNTSAGMSVHDWNRLRKEWY